MKYAKSYPTTEHENAANKFVEIFSKDSRVNSILLVNSCARGKATKDSCLDLVLLINNLSEKEKIELDFKNLLKSVPEFIELKKAGRFSHIDLFITDGQITPNEREWESGPDEFELAIGNLFIYSFVLFDKKDYFLKLTKKYLPYYSENLRKKKLAEATKFFLNNIHHVQLYVDRELYFAAFDRLYKASQEFLQALFISKKVYPISYAKWIKEQLVEILGMPRLYSEFVQIHEINKFEGQEIAQKAEKLRKMFQENVK
jgi:predicted nucleotidyltransferase